MLTHKFLEASKESIPSPHGMWLKVASEIKQLGSVGRCGSTRYQHQQQQEEEQQKSTRPHQQSHEMPESESAAAAASAAQPLPLQLLQKVNNRRASQP